MRRRGRPQALISRGDTPRRALTLAMAAVLSQAVSTPVASMPPLPPPAAAPMGACASVERERRQEQARPKFSGAAKGAAGRPPAAGRS